MYSPWVYPMEVLLYAQNEGRTLVSAWKPVTRSGDYLILHSFCLSKFFHSNPVFFYYFPAPCCSNRLHPIPILAETHGQSIPLRRSIPLSRDIRARCASVFRKSKLLVFRKSGLTLWHRPHLQAK